jgi:hypothetical protein
MVELPLFPKSVNRSVSGGRAKSNARRARIAFRRSDAQRRALLPPSGFWLPISGRLFLRQQVSTVSRFG